MVGAVMIFQAVASLLVDSGFSYALLQRKRPSRLDYSTVLWFNLGVAAMMYVILFFCAPLIADCFQCDSRLIPLSRTIFISMILNASVIVQVNRLMKAMSVRMVAVSNSISLVIGAVVGIGLAVTGFGAWAIVWQTISVAAIKAIVLWTSSRWRPMWRFSWRSLRSYFGIGSKMMLTSFLSTIFQNIQSFFIGNQVGLRSLGYYSQSDKWSKMGITSVSQILTSTFIPTLSSVQDEPERFRAITSKINRFTAYVVYPVMIGLMLMATPIFHTLFGTKWDPSIILFQLLLLRGIFFILTTLYNNILLALGHGTTILRLEMVRDILSITALLASLPVIGTTTPDDPVYGLTVMLWGQTGASVITWIATLACTIRATGLPLMRFIADNAPFVALTGLIVPIAHALGTMVQPAWLQLLIEAATGLVLYLTLNQILHSRIQHDILSFLRRK